MKYTKPPITIEEQIEKLQKRGLKFDNPATAHGFLCNISYYRLRAYTYPFQDNDDPDHPFIRKVSFEEIIQLYIFDRKLRVMVFDAIEKIEVALRTQIIYQYALKYGSHWHLLPELYKKPDFFANHIVSLQNEIGRSNETFIKHYKEKYTTPADPPSWMSLEVSSMGLLSKIYQNLKRCEEKKSVARYFGLPDPVILESWMFCISNIRNTCAHHSRLWNRRFPSKPIFPYRPIHTFINYAHVYPNKLYASLCCIEYILKIISPNNCFNQQLIKLMEKCPLAQHKEMGFPANWQKEPLWNH
jgi:abortive infection bacteriophage resistance protein